MHTHADKTRENKSHSVANAVSQKSSGKSTFQFEDNRPEATVQRKLQDIVSKHLQTKNVESFSSNKIDNDVIQRFKLDIQGLDGELLDTRYMIDIHNYILEKISKNDLQGLQNLRQATIRTAIKYKVPRVINEVNSLIDNLTKSTATANSNKQSEGTKSLNNNSEESVPFNTKKRGGSLAAAVAALPTRGKTQESNAARAQEDSSIPIIVNISFASSGSASRHLGDKFKDGNVLTLDLIKQKIKADISSYSTVGEEGEIKVGIREFINRGGNKDAVEYYIKYRINSFINGQYKVFCWHAGPSGTGRR